MIDLLIMVGGTLTVIGIGLLWGYAASRKTYTIMNRHEELDIQGDRQWRQR